MKRARLEQIRREADRAYDTGGLWAMSFGPSSMPQVILELCDAIVPEDEVNEKLLDARLNRVMSVELLMNALAERKLLPPDVPLDQLRQELTASLARKDK